MNYLNRLHKLQKGWSTYGCEMLLIEDTLSLEYLTGLHLSAGKLLVTPETATLCVDGRYFEHCRRYSPCEVVLLPENGIIDLLPEDLRSLGFVTDKTTYKEYLELQAMFSEESIHLVPIENPVKKLRSIKEPEEIVKLQKAAALGSEGYDYVVSLLKEGITEAQIAFELEIFWKRKGGKSLAFEPIIAFGANSSQPHYRAGNTKLKQGDTVLIDIGVVLDGYHSDMTRVVFWGEPSLKILEIYAIVQKAQQAALKLCKPGATFGELDDAARTLIKEHGYGDYFSHSLGHGIGLEIHEYPTLKRALPYANTPLEPGMAITIEPGIYLPGIGGVRLEDLVVITKGGHENLTQRSTDIKIC